MATTDKGRKARIQVTISPQLLQMLDGYCSAIGVSRSAFIQTVLGQTLYSIERIQGGAPSALAAMAAQTDAE